jgi:hypothetical protein
MRSEADAQSEQADRRQRLTALRAMEASLATDHGFIDAGLS